MSSNKRQFVKEVIENKLSKIDELENAISSLIYIKGLINDKRPSREPTKLEESFEAIMNHIFRKMSENYRDLFMFSTISKDEELINRAKKKAFERFFKENSEIMTHLGFDGAHPSELERAFRKELESLKEE